MVIFAAGIMPDFENDRPEPAPGPSDCAELLRIIVPPVNQVCLIEDLLRLLQADSCFSLTTRLFADRI
jgi:hypothetical protein